MINFEEEIKSLLFANKGDAIRLEEMLSRVLSGKQLYRSDTSYLMSLSDTSSGQTSESKEKKKSNKEKGSINKTESKIVNRGITSQYRTFAISFNKYSGHEVKIHARSCHHVARATQEGSVKWTTANSLLDAINTARKLATQYGQTWKYPRCCLYYGNSFFTCDDCKRYSDYGDNTYKKHVNSVRVIGTLLLLPILLGIFIGSVFTSLGFLALLFVIGIIILGIENAIAKQVCKNCDSQNWSMRG